MVQQYSFNVQIVMADSKNPFKEHYKDDKVYVEAEPDAEYFIKIEKTAKTDTDILFSFFVDGQNLGYSGQWQKDYIDSTLSSSYHGLWSRKNGISHHKALKFTKPRIVFPGQQHLINPGLLMGKIEIKVYEGILSNKEDTEDFKSSIQDPRVSIDNMGGGIVKKKNLRSGEGTTTTEERECKSAFYLEQGSLLDTITINYCSALGLIEVGVLPKPGLWEYHRMKRPAIINNDNQMTAVRPQKIRRPVLEGNNEENAPENELFDLSNDD